MINEPAFRPRILYESDTAIPSMEWGVVLTSPRYVGGELHDCSMDFMHGALLHFIKELYQDRAAGFGPGDDPRID
jgi:hypothetical protein